MCEVCQAIANTTELVSGIAENCPTSSLTWGTNWDTSTGTTELDVYFAPNNYTFGDSGGFDSEGWNAYEKQQFILALEAVAAVTMLSFNIVTNAADAELLLVLDTDQIAYLDPADQFLGFFNIPNGSNAPVSGVFDGNGAGWDNAPGGGLELGGYGYVTIVHELLHGLGLAHPHDNGGTSSVMSGVTSSFDDYGDYDLNQGIFTTMSYNSGYFTGDGSTPVSYDYGFEAGPMALDIAVLQQIYGANMSTETGDNIYYLPQTNDSGTAWISIWDAGGEDTIAYGGSDSVVIDLRPATLQYGEGGGGYVSAASGIKGGYTIANGAIIENATGGSGNDTLVGNGADNVLTGNGGNDELWWTGTMICGGTGNDTLQGDSGSDDASVTSGTNTIYGGSGFDDLDGGSGVDTIFGGSGNDTITGGGSGDTLYGGRGDDDINGDGGADIIVGGMGADTLTGGAGADTFVFNAMSDSFIGNADTIDDFGNGTDQIDLSALDISDLDVSLSTSGGDTTVLIDSNGDGTDDMAILLTGTTSVDVANDFIF